MAARNSTTRKPPRSSKTDPLRNESAQTIPGIDLRQILDEFEKALAIVETASNSLRGSPITIGHLRSEVLALSQGVAALRAVGRTLNLVTVRVKS
jgi:hypothetical protein